MRFLASIFELLQKKKLKRETINDYQKELRVLQGRDLFKKLLKLGQMPVAFL